VKIAPEDLDDLSVGFTYLGVGGGGDPYVGGLIARRMIGEHGAPEVVELDAVPDDWAIFTIAVIGSPSVMVEKHLTVEACEFAIAKLEQYRGRRADAFMPVEIGGYNTTLPIMMAARRGVPVVNADGMGRAFPEVQMVTFNVYGVHPTPLVLANEHLEFAVIEARDASHAERIVRGACVAMGAVASIASYPMTGRQARESSIAGSITHALGVGRALRQGRREGDPVGALLEYLRTTRYYQHAVRLFDGKVVDVERRATGGFTVGHCLMEGLDDPGDRLEIRFQNEFLGAWINGQIKAVVPDLVSVVDRETGQPITTEMLRYGQRLAVIGMSAPPILRRSEGLAVWGPRAFGLDLDFTPLESL
jgi:DUF917 family protein